MRFLRTFVPFVALVLAAGIAVAANPAYTVRPGDTLMSIAREKLGASSRWQEIYDLNRDKLESPDRLKDGMRLRLPPAVPPAPAAASTPAARTAPMGAPAATVPQPTGIHIVQAGETLMSIARSRLGAESRWSEIYELNKDRMADPNQVRAGMTLRLPYERPVAATDQAPAAVEVRPAAAPPAPASSSVSIPSTPPASTPAPVPSAEPVAEAEESSSPTPAPITILTLPGNVGASEPPAGTPAATEPEIEPVITPVTATSEAAPMFSAIAEPVSPSPEASSAPAAAAERPLLGSSIEPVSNDANQALARARAELLAARRQAGLTDAAAPAPVSAPATAPAPTTTTTPSAEAPSPPRATASVEVIPPPAREPEVTSVPTPPRAPVTATPSTHPATASPAPASQPEARPMPRGPKVLVQPFDMRTGPGRDRDIGVAVYRNLTQGFGEEGRLARTAGEAGHHVMGEYWCSGENVTIRAWVQRRFTILKDFQWTVAKADLAVGSPFYDTMRAEISTALSTL